MSLCHLCWSAVSLVCTANTPGCWHCGCPWSLMSVLQWLWSFSSALGEFQSLLHVFSWSEQTHQSLLLLVLVSVPSDSVCHHFVSLRSPAGSVVSGAGAFEVAVADALVKHKPNVKGRAQLGVQAFADALLVIPKVSRLFLFSWEPLLLCHAVDVVPSPLLTLGDVFKPIGRLFVFSWSLVLRLLQVLAQNSGYDPQETVLKLQTEYKESGQLVGVDLSTGQNHSTLSNMSSSTCAETLRNIMYTLSYWCQTASYVTNQNSWTVKTVWCKFTCLMTEEHHMTCPTPAQLWFSFVLIRA